MNHLGINLRILLALLGLSLLPSDSRWYVDAPAFLLLIIGTQKNFLEVLKEINLSFNGSLFFEAFCCIIKLKYADRLALHNTQEFTNEFFYEKGCIVLFVSDLSEKIYYSSMLIYSFFPSILIRPSKPFQYLPGLFKVWKHRLTGIRTVQRLTWQVLTPFGSMVW